MHIKERLKISENVFLSSFPHVHIMIHAESQVLVKRQLCLVYKYFSHLICDCLVQCIIWFSFGSIKGKVKLWNKRVCKVWLCVEALQISAVWMGKPQTMKAFLHAHDLWSSTPFPLVHNTPKGTWLRFTRTSLTKGCTTQMKRRIWMHYKVQ